jgi:predicted nucleotidyltransferase
MANGSPDQLLERFLAAADGAGLGNYCAVLYGSQARGHALPTRSDVNLLLILDEIDPARLRALGPAFRLWEDAGQPPPLILRRQEWERSADAFPLEIADMRSAYRVLRGENPLARLEVERSDLRRALERELRGKLLRLRQAYATFAGRPERLTDLARRSIGSIVFLLRMLAVVTGETPPGDPRQVVALAGRLAGFAPEPVEGIVAHRADDRWRCSDEEFAGYLGAVESAARFVDQLQTGERK